MTTRQEIIDFLNRQQKELCEMMHQSEEVLKANPDICLLMISGYDETKPDGKAETLGCSATFGSERKLCLIGASQAKDTPSLAQALDGIEDLRATLNDPLFELFTALKNLTKNEDKRDNTKVSEPAGNGGVDERAN